LILTCVTTLMWEVVAPSGARAERTPVPLGTGAFTSGQLTAGAAQSIDVTRTAFTHSQGAGVTSVTWNPVVSVQLPLASVAGPYTGTLTFSVA
jgi:hypothetical protein